MVLLHCWVRLILHVIPNTCSEKIREIVVSTIYEAFFDYCNKLQESNDYFEILSMQHSSSIQNWSTTNCFMNTIYYSWWNHCIKAIPIIWFKLTWENKSTCLDSFDSIKPCYMFASDLLGMIGHDQMTCYMFLSMQVKNTSNQHPNRHDHIIPQCEILIKVD